MSGSGQKFVARNRAPRVQIEYDVELYGAQKSVQLPFVMGVLADLSGKSAEPLPAVADRKFLEIDIDSFDERMKALRPRAAFSVPNTLTGEGNLPVDLTFESMDDFSPAAVAARVGPLARLLEARTQLSHLATYMDGKTGAEALIARLLADPAALSALAAGTPRDASHDAALDALRAVTPAPDTAGEDDTTRALEALRAGTSSPSAPPRDDTAALDALRASAPAPSAAGAEDEAALAALRAAAPAAGPSTTDDAEAALRSLRDTAPTPPETTAADDPDALLSRSAASAAASPLAAGEHSAPAPGEAGAEASPPSGAPAQEEDAAPRASAGEEKDDVGHSALDMPDDDGEELPEADAEAEAEAGDTDPLDIDALLAGTPADAADLAADAWGPEAAAPRAPAEDAGAREAGDVDLDALLAELSASAGAAPDTGLPDEWAPDFSAPHTPADHEDTPADAATGEDDLLDLDALLGEDPAADPDALPDPDPDASGDPGLDALPAEESFPAQDDTDFDDLSDTDGPDAPPAGAAPSGAAEVPFGRMSLAPPDDLGESRRGIRIALMGDFSGRASRGICETGDALARRKPIRFDIDRLDEVIARFATTLVLPLGPDGAGIEVPLASLDDLHPDALHDNVEVFAELAALRRSVARGDGAAAIATLRGWAAGELPEVRPQQRRAKGAAVPADRRLSDFRALIGAPPAPARPEPAEELIRRIVAPHVRAAPDPDQPAMLAAVDEALSAAMRAILHHPDFQAVEATWRALELIARRVGGAGAEIVLYDVSAEEWAADLAAQEDLAQSGLFRMLAEEPRLDEGQGALSAVFGLYTLEETPPHAELMARMSRISAWMEAPFVTAISTRFLETPMAERAPLVRRTWEALRALPEARYVGLAAPRFLLRLPYGRRTEPVEPFDFEEFRLRDGLKGMLWANPVVLCAILMAETANRMGPKMRLGEVMSLDDMPLHHMTDEHGDQVALPCTERLLDTRRTAEVVARGFMPVLSLKGRNAVRQGSFQSLSGGDLAGPWASAKSAGGSAGPSLALAGRMPSETDAAPGAASGAATRAAPGAAAPAGTTPPAAAPAAATAPAADDVSDDALSGADSPAADSSVLDDLDALLASFADDEAAAPAGDDDGMDPELAALLKDL